MQLHTYISNICLLSFNLLRSIEREHWLLSSPLAWSLVAHHSIHFYQHQRNSTSSSLLLLLLPLLLLLRLLSPSIFTRPLSKHNLIHEGNKSLRKKKEKWIKQLVTQVESWQMLPHSLASFLSICLISNLPFFAMTRSCQTRKQEKWNEEKRKQNIRPVERSV